MKKRIFIAIKIPPNVEKSVELWQNKHSGFNVRWIKPKNLHITLIPPWYVDENQLVEVINQTKLALGGKAPFMIEFSRVLFGPPGKTPRLIWAEAKSSKEFIGLKTGLEEALFNSRNSGFYKKDKRQPKIHLTLAIFKPHEIDANPALARNIKTQKSTQTLSGGNNSLKTNYSKGGVKQIPPLNEAVKWTMAVDSIAIMESELKRSGVEYTILESVQLQ